ncbi:hypothetical protein [Streptomyces sp. NPDC020917]|uniref:hypothetical protein n=1 Tax=Streptomyces sp. NPDC020917 TaxID=3365102 RepID=UPI003790CE50
MAKVTGRRVVAAAVLAVSAGMAVAACGQEGTADDAPPSAPVRTLPGSHSPAGDPGSGSSPASAPASASVPASAPASPSTGTTGQAGAASRVVYFSVSDRVPGAVHEVERDRAGLDAFVRRVSAQDAGAARAIEAGARATDFSRAVLVAWTQVTGCSAATSAALEVSGDRLELRVDQPAPPPECFAPQRVTVVFEVPKDRMPGRPVFDVAGRH